MKVILLAGVFAASTAFGAHAAGTKLTQAECDTLWNQANPSGAATITQAQAQPYVTDFKAANLRWRQFVGSERVRDGLQERPRQGHGQQRRGVW